LKIDFEDHLKQSLIMNKNLKEVNIEKYLIGLNLTQRDNLIAFGFDSDLNLRSIESTFVIKHFWC
jgi:5-formaminoimidazole-4-carboxamide-1-beta-D-ribofuranosyl 5'-monophosphate synthetase